MKKLFCKIFGHVWIRGAGYEVCLICNQCLDKADA